jgi:hypothetical protein
MYEASDVDGPVAGGGGVMQIMSISCFGLVTNGRPGASSWKPPSM